MIKQTKKAVINIERHSNFKKFTPGRVAILGMLLALMISLKYVFGFVPGIEVISFMFVFLGIFLPWIDLLLLITSFNLLVMVVYGFGAWWFMYWIIWPVDAIVSKGLSKVTKNRFVFGVWGFIAGLSVFFWYFWSDIVFFGVNFALLNVISAIPINLIEGMTTMICIIVIAPGMAKVFKHYSLRFWGNENEWDFKPVKHKTINTIVTTIVVLVAITGIILLFVYNSWFLELKEALGHIHVGSAGDGIVGDFTPDK